ncbi:MAG: flagellar biosynthesis protein FlgA, partial [Comamonadaceae bacterium CG17_big_fil_post_rev_8_21_14_2_50_60_13]
MIVRLLRFLKTLGVAVGCALAIYPAQAQTADVEISGLYTQAQRWLDQALARQDAGLPLRMEVVVGQLDPRLKLASCQ